MEGSQKGFTFQSKAENYVLYFFLTVLEDRLRSFPSPRSFPPKVSFTYLLKDRPSPKKGLLRSEVLNSKL